MTTDHALFFIWNEPQAGKESHAMECFTSVQSFWTKRKEAGDIASFENVMLASTRNQDMPVGFLLVTGERAKLQEIRWENDEFLNLHATTMMTFNGYACIDGYAGQGLQNHLGRLQKLMNK